MHTNAGRYFSVDEFYDRALIDKLKKYRSFCYCDDDGGRDAFPACFLPWLAQALGHDLVVEDPFQKPASRFMVPADGNREQLAAKLFDEIKSFPPRILLIDYATEPDP
jgi:hypothetical protein